MCRIFILRETLKLQGQSHGIALAGAKALSYLVMAATLNLVTIGHLAAQVNALRGDNSLRLDNRHDANERPQKNNIAPTDVLQKPARLTEPQSIEMGSTLFRQLENTLFKPHEPGSDRGSSREYADPEVQRAGFESDIDSESLAIENRFSGSLSTTGSAEPARGQPDELGDSAKTGSFSGFRQVPLNDTVKKLAINTGLVLVVAVALLLVMKKRTGTSSTGNANKHQAAVEIEQTVNLGGKSVLKIVRIGAQQLAIAMDPGGIKSVVSLSSGFAETMESVAEEEPIVPPHHWMEIMKQLERARDQANSSK